MNDKLIMDNILLLLKSTSEVFLHGTLESANDKVQKEFKNGLDDIIKLQNNTYIKMMEYEFYTVSNIDNKMICKALTKLEEN